ncbi:hypothetical protein MAR_028115, partial [Mya arenaria]
QHNGYILGDSGYNEALVRTRVTVERSFGVLKRRFPCLSYGLRLEPEMACQVIIACVFLHNYGIERRDIMANMHDATDIDQPQADVIPANENGLRYRDIVAQRYF